MRKIGIITYHRSHNYGAVLQAYGLKTYLENKNDVATVEMVDYWPNYRKGMYDLFRVDFKNMSVLTNIRILIKTILLFNKNYTRYNRFNQFISKELGLKFNKPMTKGKQIEKMNIDTLFFGSDQIWRYNEFSSFSGLDPVYWGEYPKKSKIRKIAYAASMGELNPEKLNKEKIKNFLSNFLSIGVREKPLLDFVQPLTNIEIKHVLDPVFLLNRSQWNLLAQKGGYKKSFKKKYLIIYNLNSSQEVYDLANKIAKEMSLEIYELSGRAKSFKFGKTIKDNFGPREFLNAFLNAEFVIASSFHGVAFSILFQKNFLSMGMKNNADRVKSLLTSLEISNHYIEKVSEATFTEIDYKKVNEKLDILKERSKTYIDNSLFGTF